MQDRDAKKGKETTKPDHLPQTESAMSRPDPEERDMPAKKEPKRD